MEPMQHFPIKGFGLDGLVKDIPTTARSATQLSRADNVRIQDGQISTFPAFELLRQFTKTPVFAHPFYLSDDTGGHIICFDDGTISYFAADWSELDITPAETVTVFEFTACQVNDIFIISNGVQTPWQITQTDIGNSTGLVPLVNWPPEYRAQLFANYKNHVVAGLITISGTPVRSLIKWSHPVSPGDTSLFWDHQDPTLLAGENVLAVAGRNITGIQPLRDNLIIYFDQSVWRMTFVGGEYVMNFAKVFTDDGCVGPHSFTDFDGSALVVGFRGIYRHDGYSKASISDGKITRWFYRNAVINKNLKMSYYPQRREVYILYSPSTAYNEAGGALVFDVIRGAFSVLHLPGETGLGGAVQIYLGPRFTQAELTYDDVADVTYDDSADLTYNEILKRDDDVSLYLLAQTDQRMYIVDTLLSTAHLSNRIFIEIDRLDMDPVFQTTGDKIKYLSRVYPKITGGGTVQLSLGVAMTPTEGIEWKPWVSYNIDSDHAIDVRGAGRYVGMRIRSEPGNVQNFQLFGFDVETMIPDSGRR